MYFFQPHLLQSLSEFQIHTNPKAAIAFVVAIVMLTALMIYMNVSTKVKNSKAFKGEGVDLVKWHNPQVDHDFYQMIKTSGLTKLEVEKLEKILGFSGENPEEVLFNNAKLDAGFEHTYTHILRESPPENVQEELSELFSIRNAVEYFLAVRESGSVENVPHKFRWKQTNIKCLFHLVVTKKSALKFKMKKKLVFANKSPHDGTLLNVSQSGCAIQTAQSIKVDSFLKIEFKVNDTLIVALGSVRELDMNDSNCIYHVEFIKLPKSSIVALNAFIFGYSHNA
jgi:hypothetical protein